MLIQEEIKYIMIIVASLLFIYLIYKVSQLERVVNQQQVDLEKMKALVKVMNRNEKSR